MTEATAAIVAVIQSIPEGKVSSYGRIAKAAGMRNGARQVVRVLHSMSETMNLPWHRVIRGDGFIALPEGGGKELQTELLRSEGVEVLKNGFIKPEYFVY